MRLTNRLSSPPFALLRPSFADPGFGEAVSFTAGSGDEAPSIISLNLLPDFFLSVFFCVLFRRTGGKRREIDSVWRLGASSLYRQS